MAIGIRYGTNEPSAEKRSEATELAKKLYQGFEKQNGTIMCRELIGFDLSDEEQRKRANEEDVFELKCKFLVKRVVESLASLGNVTV